jgi:site-specific DNA-cytosine methylase
MVALPAIYIVQPVTGSYLDILFRMLQPHELADAHSFPKHYVFTGTKEDQTAQIGNSVPVKTAQAHHRALLLQHFKLKTK